MNDRHTGKKQGRLSEYMSFFNLYFRDSREEISKINIISMKTAGYGGLAMLLAFVIITPLIFPTWNPGIEYWIMIPVLGGFGIFASVYSRAQRQNYYVVQTACLLFYVAVLLCLANVGMAPVEDRFELFVGCFFVLMPVVFIVRPWQISFVMVVFTAGYAFLSYQVKDPYIANHDVFTMLVGLVFGQAAMLITFKLRVKDFLSREKYKRLSQMDLLTGLLNKRSYEACCQRSMRERLSGQTGALFVFDVDDFKIINDTFGHVTGDNVLEMIGHILKGIFREELAGRIGGDEFSAYIHIDSAADVDAFIAEKAEQILTQVRESTRKAFKIEVTVSIGVCATDNSEIEYREMYLNADRALYGVKQSTHDGWKMYKMK